MHQAVKRVSVCFILLTSFSVSADQADATLAVMEQSIIEEPGTEPAAVVMAKVVTGDSFGEECLAPVTINTIDGVKQVMPEPGFLIEPGVHTVNGRAVLDLSKCRPPDGGLAINRAPDLEVFFEAGKTYYIAYDRSAPDTAEWQLIVWKVEQEEPPEDPNMPVDEDPPTELDQVQP
jgi:hypothetical protein